MNIPKIAVIATGGVAALLVATINPAPMAQAYSTPPASSCTGCHSAGGSVAATTPVSTLAAGAAYTLTLAFAGGSGNSGYAITGGATPVIGSAAAGATRTQAMTAPAVTTTYTVYMRQGVAASTTFTITVATTTPPPTTVPTTTVPTTTVPTTTVPTTTLPPTSTTKIVKLSPTHGRVDTKVTISGQNFGRRSGTVKLGTVAVRTSDWSRDRVTFKVPRSSVGTLPVTVTPRGGTVSNAVNFIVDPPKVRDDDGEDDGGMSPTGARGVKHLGMYASYGAMNCAACHNGTSQPAPPSISMEMADMEPGIACATCHAAGKEEDDEPIFVSEMATPGNLQYTRCSDCHTVTGSGDDD